MDRQEAALIVVGVEQRELLMAMHDVGGVVDIKRSLIAASKSTPNSNHANFLFMEFSLCQSRVVVGSLVGR
jgi:hypothetical protein